MAADLNVGSVPPYYREVYDILCPNQENNVDQDMFIKLLVKSSLPKQTLIQIWELVDLKQGYLTRMGLYKALALTAFAQQGKTVSEKLLQNFSGEELPKPSLGDLTDLRVLSIQLRREKNPTRLGLNYVEICALDTIKVTVLPEKKGLFLKHVEYEVSSQRYKSVVQRRYNDFVALHELLLQRFPYRLIPQLPPKKVMGADSQFLEDRRKALRRFLLLLARHPIISEDKILYFFLTFVGSDVQHKLREQFRGQPDEFLISDTANNCKELVPLDTTTQSPLVREQMKHVYFSVRQLRDIMERMVERSEEAATDMLVFGKELSSLSNCPSPGSDWGSGGVDTWETIKNGVSILSPLFSTVSKAYVEQSQQEEETLVEELNLFLDLLCAYRDMCDRNENSVIPDHQKAMNRVIRRQGSVQAPPPDAITQAQQIENRTYFFLHCTHMETQMIHVYMSILLHVIQSLVKIESSCCNQIATLWAKMLPTVESILPSSNESNTNSSSPTPSLGSPNYPSR
ncbi:sorting nexin-8-like isoform X1 [Centruroides sculpturatus]|uniref:sorting nexin-8-like isoform X1 n=1 Tax=Centruroides sculpturatus TaxID=218467 RepID=UPI000C6C9A08|nr:sorting nexin-8-like isoform X1 [Centruroides sculpturatus]